MDLWPNAPEIFGSLIAIDGTVSWPTALIGGVALTLSFAGTLAMSRVPSRLPANLREVAARVASKAEIGRCAATSLHDVVVESEGENFKIDHVVKAAGGAVVVGSVPLEGDVLGSVRDAVWTVRNGRETTTIANPMIAVARRVHALRRTTHGALPVAGLVLYKGEARFETGAPEGIVPVASAGSAISELAKGMPSDATRSRAWSMLCTKLLGMDEPAHRPAGFGEVVRLNAVRQGTGSQTGRSAEVCAFPGTHLTRA